MRKILFFILIVFLNNCTGYKPILYDKSINFYIDEISNLSGDSTTEKIIRKLSPYRTDNKSDNKINLDISSIIDEKTTSKDSKGNELTFEKNIKVNIVSTKNEEITKFTYNESFSFNNQSIKFWNN